jgi:erythromycin esterase-like protein
MQDPYPDKSMKAMEVLDSMFKWLVRHAERRRQAPDAHFAALDVQPQQSSTDAQAADSRPREAQQLAGTGSAWPAPAEQTPAVGFSPRP